MGRARAGLTTVEDAWTNHSRQPSKYLNKEGLRDIIHRERLIELIFEGHRYWDLRRWKKATEELNKPITGWSLLQEEPETYYRERSEERREGKECVSPGRSRWSPYH